ncbi:phosphoenolpyruvate carboxykinase (GTP) [Candidatus Sumerlaeota bacterium]|nr:phosphoenolpyruvate carboxykinase (GTP) [Candidatus Sumerlaeota bacterium]
MSSNINDILQKRLSKENLDKLLALSNHKLHKFVADSIQLCNPDSVFVGTDSPEDIAYIRRKAIELGEEAPLNIEGHTIHFDGFYDQARDKANTRYLVPEGQSLGANLNWMEKKAGLDEMSDLLKDSMKGKEMLVRIFCLGPVNSPFSISAVQLTDSTYVAHSEDLLYRSGYEQFKKIGDSPDFFRVLHSAGELENFVSQYPKNRRVYIDLEDEIVYSVNTQYAGNTVGFKKLCLRLAIRKALREGWLSEHMFVMGSHGTSGRTTYFTGAFPSFCGKTSTAMIPGETIIGDDIAYLRKIDGVVRTVNVESGVFGIIEDVNAKDDPLIFKILNEPGEVIFSNVLIKDGKPYWSGDGRAHPETGVNFSGEWRKGKKDPEGKEIPPSHKNSRYTICLKALANLDPKANDPEGVEVSGVIYGGRDSDTWVPLQQSFDWAHGVITMGACLESETTAATIGKQGVRAFQPMSNLDFLSMPVGEYIDAHLKFGKGMKRIPPIFAVNYFLKDKDGNYLNDKKDKYVWLKWMEKRVHGEVKALLAPTGLIPLHEDLKPLFKQVLNKDYAREQYDQQFTIRIPENLRKIDRIEKIFREAPNTPSIFFEVMEQQKKRITLAQQKFGDNIPPSALSVEK